MGDSGQRDQSVVPGTWGVNDLHPIALAWGNTVLGRPFEHDNHRRRDPISGGGGTDASNEIPGRARPIPPPAGRPGADDIGGVDEQHASMLAPPTLPGVSPPVIAFVCAMPMELAPLSRRFGLSQRSEIDGIRLHSTETQESRMVGTVIGIGPKQAAERVGALLDAVTVERVVVVGISGAPDERTPIGTVIRPAVVVDGDTGDEFRPHSLGAAGDGSQGQLWTSAVLNTDSRTMVDLLDRGVVALDMETAAVARVCESRGVAWSVVRAISDRVSDGLVDQETLDLTGTDGKPDLWAAARYAIRHPTRLAGLVRLARDSQRAAAAAADAAAADLGLS